jgi:hypothetical protein
MLPFWLTVAFCLLGATTADAQQTGKIYRVGRLGGGSSKNTELGYVEGKNIVFELRHAEEKRLPALADDLVVSMWMSSLQVVHSRQERDENHPPCFQ